MSQWTADIGLPDLQPGSAAELLLKEARSWQLLLEKAGQAHAC